MTRFGQVVVGPPGSGKSTYCNAMMQFMVAAKRKVCIINLDPANENLTYTTGIDVMELVSLEDVMRIKQLGPNGGLLYCFTYINDNIDWLINRVKSFSNDHFILIDCPGQVELFIHDTTLHSILTSLASAIDLRLVAVNLIDSFYCADASKFISALLMSLSTMLHIELPHVNLLSKIDLIESTQTLRFGLEFYADVLDLSFLFDEFTQDKFFEKFSKLNKEIASIVEDYGLVSFLPLDISSKDSMLRVMTACDKACGYIYTNNEEQDIHAMLSSAVQAELQSDRLGLFNEKISE